MSKTTFDKLLFDFITNGRSSFGVISTKYWSDKAQKRAETIASALTTKDKVRQLVAKFSKQTRVVHELRQQSKQLLSELNPDYKSIITKESLSESEYTNLSLDMKFAFLIARLQITNSEIYSQLDDIDFNNPKRLLLIQLNQNLGFLLLYADYYTLPMYWEVDGPELTKLAEQYTTILVILIENCEASLINFDEDFVVSLILLKQLCHGMYVHVFMYFFLTQQYLRVTEYYYDDDMQYDAENRITKYNRYYQEAVDVLNNITSSTVSDTFSGSTLSSTFNKSSFANKTGSGILFVESTESDTFLDKMHQILTKLRNSEYIQMRHKDVQQFTTAQLANLVEHNVTLKSFPKTFVSVTPDGLSPVGLLDFSSSNISTGNEPWDEGRNVSYAIQFMEENVDGAVAYARKSMISQWTPGFTLKDKANPIVNVYPDRLNRSRVILRRFDDLDQSVKIVAILKDPQQVAFRDIDRDLFDIAKQPNENVSLRQTKLYLENGANVSVRFNHAQLAIHNAVANRNAWEVVFELLKSDTAHGNGTIVNAQDDQGRTPLYISAKRGFLEIVNNLLLGHGANPNLATSRLNHRQMTLLQIAVCMNKANIVELLLKNDYPNRVDVNARTKDGFTALHFAAAFNFEPIVALLLADNRTEVNAKSHFRCSQRECFSHYDSLHDISDKIASLVATSANVTALHMAYAIGSVKLVKLLLENGADMRMRTSDGSTVMHYAALNNNPELIQPEKCSSLSNSPNLRDLTPLYIAYANNNTKVAQKLLHNCADVNVRLSNSKTMLHIAVQCADANVARALLENGVSLEAEDSNGREALQYAVWLANSTMIGLLLDHHADVDALDVDGDPLVQSLYYIPYRKYSYFDYDSPWTILDQFIAHNVSINAVDSQYSNTLLHIASAFDRLSCVSYLLEKYPSIQVDVLNAQHETPLHVALRMGNVWDANVLFEKGNASVTLQGGVDNWTALNYAISGKSTNDETRAFAQKFIPVTDECHNRANSYQLLAQNVLQAAQYGKFDVIDFYAEKCAFLQEILQDPTKNNPFDLKYLSKLARYGSAHVIKALFPLKQRERFGGYDFKQLPIIEALKGCAFECADLSSEQCACVGSNNKSEVLEYLHGEGYTLVPDKALRNFYPLSTNWNALNYTILGNLKNRTFLELLTQKVQFRLLNGTKESIEIAFAELRGEHNQTLMHLAAQANKVEIAQFLLEKKVDLKAVDMDGYSPLHIASRYGHFEMVKWLIENGADVNHNSNSSNQWWGTTPLIEAVWNSGHLDVVQYLVEKHASIDETVREGFLLVHKAAQLDKAQVAMCLCNLMSSDQCTDGAAEETGASVLHFAASNNNIQLAEFMFTKGIKADEYDKHNITPIYYAIRDGGQLEMIKYLHSKGADFENENKMAENLISLAISKSKYDIAKYLIAQGSDVNTAGESKRTPLHEAVDANQMDLIQILIQNGANCSAQDGDKMTPIDYVFEYYLDSALQYFMFNYVDGENGGTLIHERTLLNDSNAVELLVERGADVNSPDSLKNTALHLAAEKGYLQVAKELVKSKCVDLAARNENNQTALDCAEANNQTDIVELLKHHSRKRRQIEHEPVSMSNSIPAYHNGASTRHSSFLINSACVIGHFMSGAFERVNTHASKLMSYTFSTTNPNGIPKSHGITNVQGIHNPNGITSIIDLNSTLLLLDVLTRRYYSSERYTMQPTRVKQFAETRACSLALVERFQEELSSFSVENEHFDWFEFYLTVERAMISEQYGEVERLLRMTVRKFTGNQTDDEIEIARMIDRVLIETLLTSEPENIDKTQLMYSNAVSHKARVDLVRSKLALEVNKLDYNLI